MGAGRGTPDKAEFCVLPISPAGGGKAEADSICFPSGQRMQLILLRGSEGLTHITTLKGENFKKCLRIIF
jgi:hypothetical protein